MGLPDVLLQTNLTLGEIRVPVSLSAVLLEMVFTPGVQLSNYVNKCRQF